MRPFHPQNFFFLHGAEYVVGEFATGHMANVQFHTVALRRVGHGVAAARAIAEQEFNVLTGAIQKRVVRWQLKLQHHDVVRHLL